MKIGAMTTSFRKPFKESLEAAAALKVDGVQIWATDITYYDPNHPVGELDPDQTTEAERKDLLATLKRLNLEISALCGDLGRGFIKPDHLREDVDKTKRMMDLCALLGVKVLTSHIGRIPADPNSPAWQTAAEALEEVGAARGQHRRVLRLRDRPRVRRRPGEVPPQPPHQVDPRELRSRQHHHEWLRRRGRRGRAR